MNSIGFVVVAIVLLVIAVLLFNNRDEGYRTFKPEYVKYVTPITANCKTFSGPTNPMYLDSLFANCLNSSEKRAGPEVESPNVDAMGPYRYANYYPPYGSPWAADSPCGICKKGDQDGSYGQECKLMRDYVKGTSNWECVSKKIDQPFKDCPEWDSFSDILAYYTVDRGQACSP